MLLSKFITKIGGRCDGPKMKSSAQGASNGTTVRWYVRLGPNVMSSARSYSTSALENLEGRPEKITSAGIVGQATRGCDVFELVEGRRRRRRRARGVVDDGAAAKDAWLMFSCQMSHCKRGREADHDSKEDMHGHFAASRGEAHPITQEAPSKRVVVAPRRGRKNGCFQAAASANNNTVQHYPVTCLAKPVNPSST